MPSSRRTGQTTSPETTAPKLDNAALAVLVALAAVVWSSIGLTRPSLWADEGATISATQRSWSDLWRLLHHIDAVHGAYYVVVKPWLDLVGVSSFALRLPSLLVAGVTVALTFLLSRRWLARGPAVVVGVLTAALPRTTWMAIEGRPWSFTALAAVLSTLALHRFVQRPSASRLLAYAVTTAVGAVLNIYLVFLVAAHGLTMLLLRVPWRRFGQWLCAALLAAVASAPVLWSSLQQRAQLGDRAPLTPVEWLSSVAVKQFALGDTSGDAQTDVPRWLWSGCAVLVAAGLWLIIVLAVVLIIVRDRKIEGGWAWVLPWLIVPPVAVGALSLLGLQLYHPRYFSFTVPSFALAVGMALASFRRPRLTGVVVGVMCVLCLPIFVSQRGPASKNGYDWSEVAQVVAQHRPAVGAVYYSPDPSMRVLGISYPAAVGNIRDLTMTETPAAEASLDGTSADLTSLELAKAPDRIVGLWSNRASQRDADLTVLETAGYRSTGRWTGPQTTVEFLERDPLNSAPR